MDRITFLVSVFCLIEEWLKEQRVRQRGPTPILSDSEVLTIEVAGAFFGVETDEGIDAYFRRFYPDLFPRLARGDRTTFTRQAANLWKVKEALWQHLLTRITYDAEIAVIDSCPLPVCRFARSPRCRRLREYAAFGDDDVSQQIYYGLRLHVRLCWPGVIVAFALAPANEAGCPLGSMPVATDALLPDTQGWVLADRNDQSAERPHPWSAPDVHLLIPPKQRKNETATWPRQLTHKRRRIETLFSQLVERYHSKRMWARDLWHLAGRWLRTVLSHTIALLLCQQTGLPPLQFDKLLTD